MFAGTGPAARLKAVTLPLSLSLSLASSRLRAGATSLKAVLAAPPPRTTSLKAVANGGGGAGGGGAGGGGGGAGGGAGGGGGVSGATVTTGSKVDALAQKHLGRALTEGETRAFACEYVATTAEQVSIGVKQ